MSAPSVRKTSYLIKESILHQLLGRTQSYVAGTLPRFVGSSGGAAHAQQPGLVFFAAFSLLTMVFILLSINV